MPVSIYLVDIDHSLAALERAEQEKALLAADEIARFERSRAVQGDKDARLWRAARIALRIVLQNETGSAYSGSAYEREPGGRPRLSRALGLAPPPEFSLAHTSTFALIAISRVGAVGVDIEPFRRIDVSAERRKRIVCAAERLSVEALPRDDDARFLQAWVRLEAVAKATGLGIGHILTEMGVIGPQQPASSFGYRDVQVRDLDVGKARFAAISAAQLPQNIVVQAF